MTVTATSPRRRRSARIAGAAAAFGGAVVLTGLLSSGLGAGDTAAAAAVVTLRGNRPLRQASPSKSPLAAPTRATPVTISRWSSRKRADEWRVSRRMVAAAASPT